MGQAAGVLAAIVLIIAAGWLVYTGCALLLKASVTAKLGVLTASVGVVTFIYNNNRQQIREIKARQFNEKRQAYQKFFDFMFDIFSAQRSGVAISEADMIDRMHLITKDLMVWGSADTINQYNEFMRQSAAPQPEGSLTIFKHVETLMRSFRRDLGHNDRKLENMGLSKLLLKAEEHGKLDNSL